MKKINKLNSIIERYNDIEFLKADGLDEAVIGVDERTYQLVYDSTKCIDILAKNMEVTKKDLDQSEIEDGMTIKEKKYELAREYFYYNTVGAFVGDKTPIFVDTDF
jgi:hypothetical protein